MMTYSEYKSVPHLWDISIPSHWKVLPLYAIAKEKSICNCTDLQLLSVYLDEGVVPFSTRTERRTNATSADLSKYQRVDAGDFSDAFKPKIRQTTNSINEKSANSICEKPSEAASYERASGGFAYQSKSNCGASVTVRRYSSGLPFKINSA